MCFHCVWFVWFWKESKRFDFQKKRVLSYCSPKNRCLLLLTSQNKLLFGPNKDIGQKTICRFLFGIFFWTWTIVQLHVRKSIFELNISNEADFQTNFSLDNVYWLFGKKKFFRVIAEIFVRLLSENRRFMRNFSECSSTHEEPKKKYCVLTWPKANV